MRPHQTLAECNWASFCYRKQHCKEGRGGGKMQKTVKVVQVFKDFWRGLQLDSTGRLHELSWNEFYVVPGYIQRDRSKVAVSFMSCIMYLENHFSTRPHSHCISFLPGFHITKNGCASAETWLHHYSNVLSLNGNILLPYHVSTKATQNGSS